MTSSCNCDEKKQKYRIYGGGTLYINFDQDVEAEIPQKDRTIIMLRNGHKYEVETLSLMLDTEEDG
jgi:hypothetical protein